MEWCSHTNTFRTLIEKAVALGSAMANRRCYEESCQGNGCIEGGFDFA